MVEPSVDCQRPHVLERSEVGCEVWGNDFHRRDVWRDVGEDVDMEIQLTIGGATLSDLNAGEYRSR